MKDEIKLRWLYEDDPDADLDGDGGGDGGGDGDVDGDGEPMYPKSELDKAVQRRQAALKRAKAAEEKAKELASKMKNLPDPDEHDALKSQFTELQNQLKELKDKQAEQELQKIEDEKERERVKMEQEFKKERAKFQAELEKMNVQLDSFQSEKAKHEETLHKFRLSTLESEIMAIAAPKAYNPRQVVKLIGEEFNFDTEDDRWYKNVYDNKGKLVEVLTVEEYVNGFLADKDNENLLKADIKRGSDTPRGNRQPSGDATPPADQTPTDKMYKWAEMSGLNVNSKSSVDDKTWLYNTYTRLHTKPGAKEQK